MKRFYLWLLAFVIAFPGPVLALEGTGALADRISAGGEVLMRGRTAPWAEVVVVDENRDDEVIALAEIEPHGRFKFRFKVNAGQLATLTIFAIDELGTTSRVRVEPVVGVEILLPPTIVGDKEDTSTDRVALTGYTHPVSEVELNLSSDKGFEETFYIDADDSGRWRFNRGGFPAGRYTGRAKSRFGGSLESEWSQDIFFEILIVAVPPGVQKVSEILIPIPAVREILQQQPEAISRVLAPVAAVPIAGLFLRDLLALLLKLIFGLLHLLGWRKEKRSWGVVYDAATKQPLGRAIVRLYEAVSRRLIETDVTGTEGTFAFLPRAGSYLIKVVRAGFAFPSALVRGRGRDGEYEHLYHGEELAVKEGEEIRVSIPMDPMRIEEVRRWSMRRVLVDLWILLGWILLLMGLSAAVAAILRGVTLINLLVLAFYLGLIFWRAEVGISVRRSWGVVKDVVTKKGVAWVSVALYEVEFRRLVQRRVSNEHGRFLLVVPPGRYTLDVASAEWVWDKTRKDGYRGEILEVKKRNRALRVKIWVKKR